MWLHEKHLSCLSAAENKPIWMHAEEREEMSKVRPPSDLPIVTQSIKNPEVQVRHSESVQLEIRFLHKTPLRRGLEATQ